MSLLKRSTQASREIHETINDHDPIRVAFLGGPKSGKSSTISKLSLGTFQDTYYPTHKVSPMLVNFNAKGNTSRIILDEHHNQLCLEHLVKSNEILLSPIVGHCYTLPSKPTQEVVKDDVVIHSTNNYYTMYNYQDELTSGYTPPHISPILVELIDTPSFDPNTVVPFLEASIYNKLDPELLRNLANSPRRPVNTKPLLVASGASELDGNVDGYILVYSAIPTYNPPSYNEKKTDFTTEKAKFNFDPIPGDVTFNLLAIIKNALDEAWLEYLQFRQRYNQKKESDIFSLKSAFKSMWKDKSIDEIQEDPQVNPNDPLDPNGSPPIWIVCTHSNSPLKSPILIENGAKLSKHWKCGFVAIDNMNDNVDEVVALIVKDVLARKKLQKSKRK